jgi:hypothetical protein
MRKTGRFAVAGRMRDTAMEMEGLVPLRQAGV